MSTTAPIIKAQRKTMPRNARPNSTLYLRPVPTAVKNFFKSECAKRNLTMLESQIEFMRHPQLLDEMKKLKQRREREEASAKE